MLETTRAWWKDALERLLWTFVQGALAIPTLDGLGWVDFGEVDLWKAMAAGGTMAAFSFIKTVAAKRLSEGSTAQLGAKTYSYTEAGPGAAGADV